MQLRWSTRPVVFNTTSQTQTLIMSYKPDTLVLLCHLDRFLFLSTNSLSLSLLNSHQPPYILHIPSLLKSECFNFLISSWNKAMNLTVSFLLILLVSLPHLSFAIRKLEGNLSLSLSLSLTLSHFPLIMCYASFSDAEVNKVRKLPIDIDVEDIVSIYT